MRNGQKILQNNQEPQLGDIMYEDIDNNGNINDADRTVIGNPFPKMQYSFNLGFSYKDFDVNTFWQGIAGVYRYNWDETTISNGGNKTSRCWTDGLKVIRMEACLVWEELLIITTLHFG